MQMVEELAALSVNLGVYQSDVGIETDLQRLISDCPRTMPPIGRGIHGAYVKKVRC